MMRRLSGCSLTFFFFFFFSFRRSLFSCPDVFSYDEDDMVLDSKLPEHLSHFGIDMMTMEKARQISGFIHQSQMC